MRLIGTMDEPTGSLGVPYMDPHGGEEVKQTTRKSENKSQCDVFVFQRLCPGDWAVVSSAPTCWMKLPFRPYCKAQGPVANNTVNDRKDRNQISQTSKL